MLKKFENVNKQIEYVELNNMCIFRFHSTKNKNIEIRFITYYLWTM